MNDKKTSPRGIDIARKLTVEELLKQGFFVGVSSPSHIAASLKNKTKFAQIRVKSSKTSCSKNFFPIYEDDYVFIFDIPDLIKEMKKNEQTKNLNIFYIFVVLKDRPDFFIFKAQQIYDAMKEKIKVCNKKRNKKTGPWDLKLSNLFSSKDSEKKNNWNCLREYLNQDDVISPQ